MRKIILLSDVMGIWMYNDRKAYKRLTDTFFKKNNIKLELVEKVDKEIFPKLAQKGREGKLTYKEVIENYFKAMNCKSYKKLAKEYITFEFRNLRKYIRLYKYSKRILSLLKKSGIRVIGIRDSVYSIKEMKRILKVLKVEKYFDKVYTSNSLKVEKPRLFNLFKNVKPKLFLGHDDDELLGAKKCGFVTIGLKNRKADYYISSIKALPRVIKWLIEKRSL